MHALQIIVIGATPAEIAGQRLAHLVDGRIRVGLEQRHRRHHLAGRAKAALRRQFGDEGLLHLVKFAVGPSSPSMVVIRRPRKRWVSMLQA